MVYVRLVLGLIEALTAYWQLKKERLGHDVYQQAKNTCQDLEDRLESLRDTGTESDAQLADRLREQLIEEKAHLKRVSAIRAKA
jgi:hypothetical protein